MKEDVGFLITGYFPGIKWTREGEGEPDFGKSYA